MTQRHGWISGLAIGVVVTGAMWVGAGELSPAPGPIAPTMKSLDTVESRTAIRDIAGATITIDAGGSYYLAEDITGTSIQVNASYVTLDLNGFSVVSAPSPAAITSTHSSITIRNGYIRNSVDTSIILGGSGNRHNVENVIVNESGNSGIVVGYDSTIRNCIVQRATANGIQAGDQARIVDCVSRDNDSAGIVVGNNSIVTGCSASLNLGAGISMLNGCVVDNCLAENNVGHCIEGTDGCVVSNCTVAGSTTGRGITLSTASVVRGCVARSNPAGFGISVSNNGIIHSSTAAGNSTDVSLGAQAKCIDSVSGDGSGPCS
jgi:hypothetical protein